MTSRKLNPPENMSLPGTEKFLQCQLQSSLVLLALQSSLGVANTPGFRSWGLKFSWCAAKASPTALRKNIFLCIQNTTPFLVLRSFKHLCAIPSLYSHCSAKLHVLHSFNVAFHASPYSSLFLWTTSNTQYLSDSRNLTAFELDPLSCSQEHSVLSYSCDLKLFLWTYFKSFTSCTTFRYRSTVVKGKNWHSFKHPL